MSPAFRLVKNGFKWQAPELLNRVVAFLCFSLYSAKTSATSSSVSVLAFGKNTAVSTSANLRFSKRSATAWSVEWVFSRCLIPRSEKPIHKSSDPFVKMYPDPRERFGAGCSGILSPLRTEHGVRAERLRHSPNGDR